MITRTIVLLCILLLCGCEKITAQNAVALADQQRYNVIVETRAASYSIFPDTDDAKKLKDDTFLDAMHAETANGSTFAVRADGLVATNVHVIEGTNFCTGQDNAKPASKEDAEREAGRQNEETLRRENKRKTFCLLVTQSFTKVFRARLVKMDEKNDIALLCIEHANTSLPFLKLALPGSYREGAEVLTIGSPLGNMNFMTPGFISNLDFVPQDKETGKKGARKIQFTAPILPGNSGGPLVAVATGEVVGQVVAIIMTGLGPTQMSYANPVEYLRENILDTPPCKNN
jgi:S1-C subfamily serine protease